MRKALILFSLLFALVLIPSARGEAVLSLLFSQPIYIWDLDSNFDSDSDGEDDEAISFESIEEKPATRSER